MHPAFVRAPTRERRCSAEKALSRLELAISSIAVASATGGCVLAPEGLSEERDALERSGEPFEAPLEARELPPISAPATWREVLARAFAANGEIEAAYFEWSAAVERVEIAAGWPDTNLMPSIGYLFSGGGMKAWDRTTLGIGFDPMQNLSLPIKTRKAGEVALAEARAQGQRLSALKFELQRQVLQAWLELTLLDERARIQRERAALAALGAGSAEQEAAVRGGQRELLMAHVQRREAEFELARLDAEARASLAMLNAMLAREADAPLDRGPALPEPRAASIDDAALLAAGVDNNPELAELAFAVAGRERALELARLRYLPDFNPFVAFTGSVEQMIGVGVSLPTRLPQIRAGVAEARAMLRGAAAELRQLRLDRTSAYVAALTMLRFSEREAEFLAREVRPATEQVLGSAEQAYATGMASFPELVEVRRALLDVRLALAEARIERESRLAEIEQLGGFDVETLQGNAEDRGHE